MEVSVVIPTFRRPELLRSTLRSVADQSRVDLISEVIVSENSDEVASRQVCEEFTSLPIRYISRVPALGVLRHFSTLVAEARSPWVAWVADDDMWSRYHLTEADRLLTRHPYAVGFVSAQVSVRDDTFANPARWGSFLRPWLGQTEDYPDHEIWREREIYLEMLLRTPLNLWGIVARRETLKDAAVFWEESPASWCNDRLFWCKLIQLGQLVRGREITIFLRDHSSSASSRYMLNKSAWDADSARVTSTIASLAATRGVDLRTEWEEVWSRMSVSTRQHYLCQCLPGAVQGLAQLWGEDAVACKGPSPSFAAMTKTWCRMLCPPVLWNLLAKGKHATFRVQ